MGQNRNPRTESFSIRGQNYWFIFRPETRSRPIKCVTRIKWIDWINWPLLRFTELYYQTRFMLLWISQYNLLSTSFQQHIQWAPYLFYYTLRVSYNYHSWLHSQLLFRTFHVAYSRTFSLHGKAARFWPPRASDDDPCGQKYTDPLRQNKNDPWKRLLFRGFFVVLKPVLTDGLTQNLHFTWQS